MDNVRATRERTSAVSSSSGMGAPVRGLRDGWKRAGRMCIASPRIQIGVDWRRVRGAVRRK